MMVTFVSQCEKKALKRTRRVLDAFAHRIGDNSWQTVITQEGLQAVKKLLRKTASKNTAIACHWIRSRSHTELIWTIGRRDTFNSQGHVPVNLTNKEVIMDKLPCESHDLLANTHSQALSQHLFAVGQVAVYLLDDLAIDSDKLKQSAFMAGVLHDIGKIDPAFQGWIKKKAKKSLEVDTPDDGAHIDLPKKFSFENHPRHHELSWLFAESLLQGSGLNDSQRQQIAHGIYWHHTKPFRRSDGVNFDNAEAIFNVFKKSLDKEDFATIYQKALLLIKDVSKLQQLFTEKDLVATRQEKFELTQVQPPAYKKYDSWNSKLSEFQSNVAFNALNNLVRAAVISADRLVSSCSAEELEEYLNERTLRHILDKNKVHEDSHLSSGIKSCLSGFEQRFPNSERNQAQSDAANKLAALQTFAKDNESANIGVLQGPAGCGKTKIALDWAERTLAKKIIWVCPRVQVCLGLLKDLSASDYLPNNSIEIFTGEYKKILSHGVDFKSAPETDESDYFTGDIVLTTIDQVSNAIRSHSHVDTFVQFMSAHVVFDEFHELINMTGLNLLFAELIEAKKKQGARANTLLVSATPHDYFLTEFLGIEEADIIRAPSFNQARYGIEFLSYDEQNESNPLIAKTQQNNTFVISNTAQDAQIAYLLHHGEENSILMHSKYTKKDKAHYFDQVFESFKQGGDRRFNVLRSGPIVQASLNITCDHMMSELSCAENWLQRLGRLDRFGQNSQINSYITVFPKSIEQGKQSSSCAKFLNRLCIGQSSKAWLDFLQARLKGRSEVDINELYAIYQAFYQNSASRKVIEADFMKALKESEQLINKKIMDPISVPPKSKRTEGSIKISSRSLRGDNCYVQMAVCHASKDLSLRFEDDYAYEETPEACQASSLTESIDKICGYGEDSYNLAQYMCKIHHNIKKDNNLIKKARNYWDLIKKARSPENPIYLSYTPKDLGVGEGVKAHPQAIFYVRSNRQSVGFMSVARLKEQLKAHSVESD